MNLIATLRIATIALAATAAGCAPRTTPVAAPAAAQAPSAAANVTAAAELPEGKGKQTLLAACTLCHELDEVTKFRGYYDRAQWRDVVVTMAEYGAPVQTNDIEVLADYLNEHLGRRAPASTP